MRILAIHFLLFLCSFELFGQNKDWTEGQWIKFRKWESRIYVIQEMCLRNIYNDSTQLWRVGVLQNMELRDSCFVNNKLFCTMKFNEEVPDSTVPLIFYYPNGVKYAEYNLSLVNDFSGHDYWHEKRIYYPNGDLEREVLKGNNCDSTFEYYSTGKIKNKWYTYKRSLITIPDSIVDYFYWPNGLIGFKKIRNGPFMDTVFVKRPNSKFALERQTKIISMKWSHETEIYFDSLGFSIPKDLFLEIKSIVIPKKKVNDFVIWAFNEGNFNQGFCNKQNLSVCDSILDLEKKQFYGYKRPFVNLLDTLFYSNKRILRVSESSQGILNGNVSYFSRSGMLIKKIPFVNDTIHGEVVEYFSNGNLKSMTNFDKGIAKDSAFVYYEDGKIHQRIFYAKTSRYEKIYFDRAGRMRESISAAPSNDQLLNSIDEYRSNEFKLDYEKKFFDSEGYEISEKVFFEQNPEWKE